MKISNFIITIKSKFPAWIHVFPRKKSVEKHPTLNVQRATNFNCIPFENPRRSSCLTFKASKIFIERGISNPLIHSPATHLKQEWILHKANSTLGRLRHWRLTAWRLPPEAIQNFECLLLVSKFLESLRSQQCSSCRGCTTSSRKDEVILSARNFTFRNFFSAWFKGFCLVSCRRERFPPGLVLVRRIWYPNKRILFPFQPASA